MQRCHLKQEQRADGCGNEAPTLSTYSLQTALQNPVRETILTLSDDFTPEGGGGDLMYQSALSVPHRHRWRNTKQPCSLFTSRCSSAVSHHGCVLSLLFSPSHNIAQRVGFRRYVLGLSGLISHFTGLIKGIVARRRGCGLGLSLVTQLRSGHRA